MNEFMKNLEFSMQTVTVEPLAHLAIGDDQPGRIKSNLLDEAQEAAFAADLSAHTVEITHKNTADCMDDRPTVALGDGTTDPDILDSRVVWQLPGGLVLATTKAAVAANAAYLRDAKDFQDAYLKTYEVLTSMGYEDGGHEGCGASKLVEKSVAEPVEPEILLPTVEATLAINAELPPNFDLSMLPSLLQRIDANKKAKLNDKFYASWSPQWHEEFLMSRVPQNFSKLKTADDAVHGHYADGLELVGAGNKGVGFAKNAFYRATGRMAFGITEEPMVEIAYKLGGNDDERNLILVGFADDVPNVSTHLVGKNLPAFKSVA